MPDTAVLGPFGEGDFAKNFRLAPNESNEIRQRPMPLIAARSSTRFVDCERLQPVRERTGAFHREAGADLARIGQGAAAVIAEIERPERAAAAAAHRCSR